MSGAVSNQRTFLTVAQQMCVIPCRILSIFSGCCIDCFQSIETPATHIERSLRVTNNSSIMIHPRIKTSKVQVNILSHPEAYNSSILSNKCPRHWPQGHILEVLWWTPLRIGNSAHLPDQPLSWAAASASAKLAKTQVWGIFTCARARKKWLIIHGYLTLTRKTSRITTCSSQLPESCGIDKRRVPGSKNLVVCHRPWPWSFLTPIPIDVGNMCEFY